MFDIVNNLRSRRTEKEGRSLFLPFNALHRCPFERISMSISTQSLELGFFVKTHYLPKKKKLNIEDYCFYTESTKW